MQKYQNNVLARNGDAVVGAQVLIVPVGTSAAATIYSDDGVTITPNPLTTDKNGYFEFYAADGRYDIFVNGDMAYSDVLVADSVEIAQEVLQARDITVPAAAAAVAARDEAVPAAEAAIEAADVAASAIAQLPSIPQFQDMQTQVDALTSDPANAVTSFFVPADQFRQTATGTATASSVNTRLFAWALPNGVLNYLSSVVEFPSHWNSAFADVVLTNTAANAGNVTMAVEIQQWVIGESINVSPTGQNRTVAANTVPHTSFAISPVTALPLTPGKITTLRVSRQTSGDTLPNSVAFVGVRFRKAT